MSAGWDPPPFEPMRRFWERAARHVLSAPWCEHCDAPVLYPRELCNRCHQPVARWRDLSGNGVVYAFGIEHRAWSPLPGLEVPYIVALIDLEEGGRLLSNVAGPVEGVRVGTPVEVMWHDGPDGRTVPRFKVRVA